MKNTKTGIITTITTLTLALLFLQAPAPVKGAGFDPQVGAKGVWNVISTNTNLSWWDDITFIENTTITQNGTISYILTGLHDNDRSWTTITSDVWYGNFSITFLNASMLQEVNWTRENCSTTEIGSNLALSVMGWQGGLIAPTNWTENKAQIEGEQAMWGGTLEYTEKTDRILIRYADDWGFQTTYMEYNKSDGVLFYAKTISGGFTLEIDFSYKNTSPNAQFTADPNTFVVNFPIQFLDTTWDGDHPFGYEWDFGDGSANSSLQNPTHAYNATGQYNVSLFVNDCHNETSFFTMTITIVEDLEPSASFVVNVTKVGVNESILFNSTSSGGNNPLTYLWDFGDGHVSWLEDPIHAYNATGIYTVTLTITDADGDTGVHSLLVIVSVSTIIGPEPALTVLFAVITLFGIIHLSFRKMKFKNALRC